MSRTRRLVVALLTAGAALAGPAAVPPAAAATEVYPVPAGGVYTIQGHGWGHGHGMSQWGAEGAASHGVPLTTILSSYYPGTRLARMANTPIRVLLTRDEGIDTHVLAVPGMVVRDLSTGVTARLPSGPTDWRVLATGTGLHLQYEVHGRTGWITVPLGGRTTSFGPIQFLAPIVSLVYPNYSVGHYPDAVEAVWVGGGRLASVNVVPMETYLRGVVPRESPASWAPVALQAQAIAARSYAAFERNANRSAPWDICDSTSCQVYSGADGLDPRSNAAVASTAGLVLTYGGAPIFAQFSSSDGGYTTAGSEPYLTAHPDPWDGLVPNVAHSWTARLPASALQARYPSIGRLRDIRVIQRDGNGQWGGRVLVAVLDGTTGSVTVSGADVAAAYPYGVYANGLMGDWWHPLASPPSAPQRVGGVGQDQKVLVSWAPPVSSGSDPITSYTVVSSPGGRRAVVPGGATSTPVYGLTGGVPYRFSVTAQNSGGSGPAAVTAPIVASWALGEYHSIAPVRILDTRVGHHPLGPGQMRPLQLAGVAGVPVTAVQSVQLNITAVAPTTGGFLKVWGMGDPFPAASAMTWAAGHTVAIGVTVHVGYRGIIDLFNSEGSTNLVVDVVGYSLTHLAKPGASRLVPLPPTRIVDSRTGLGTGVAAPLGPGSSLAVPVAGRAGVPLTGASAALITLTAVQPSAGTYLVAWADGAPQPATSTLSPAAGTVRANTAIVPIGPDGKIRIGNGLGSTNVVVDLLGYFAADGSAHAPAGWAGRSTAILPVRVLDTRTSVGGHPGPVPAGGTLSFRVTGSPGVPAGGVGAVAFVLTAVAPTANDYLTAYPTGAARPATSSLDVAAGQVVSNLVVVPVGAGGMVSVYNPYGRVNVVADLVGWYTS